MRAAVFATSRYEREAAGRKEAFRFVEALKRGKENQHGQGRS
jgi:hypothetical protein